MKKKLFYLSLLIFYTSNVYAETIAKPSSVDPRTRTVAYDPMQVYRIKGYYGYFTRIQFDQEEQNVQFALGDEQAWTVVAAGNNLLVKPSQPKPDTNMVVITNKRTYNFLLTSEELPTNGEKSQAPNGPDQQFLIVFNYPREEAQKRIEAEQKAQKEYAERQQKEREELQKELEKYRVAAALKSADNKVINTDYFGCGAEEILPIAAYDNNQFTYLKFAPGATIPSFFYLNHYGQESLVNYNVEDDWIVIQRTFEEITLRQGKYVACVINANRNTIRTNTGTISSSVHRILLEDN